MISTIYRYHVTARKFWGHEYRYSIDIGKRDINPALMLTD